MNDYERKIQRYAEVKSRGESEMHLCAYRSRRSTLA